jgi:hypothetical protein
MYTSNDGKATLAKMLLAVLAVEDVAFGGFIITLTSLHVPKDDAQHNSATGMSKNMLAAP